MADNEKLVFQIGFDLDSAVKDATSEWKRVQRELEAAINARPISISMDTRGLERFNTFVERTYASLEDLQDLFPEVFKETKDGEGITKRFQAMETSINAVSKEMRNLEKVWNNLSQAEKFDDDGNLTERAQELKRAYVELYQSQKTQGQTLQEITKEAINLANQEYEAQQRKKKQEEDFIRLLNLEETTLEKLQAKQGAWKQKLSQTEIGTSDWSNAIAEVQRLETKIKDLQKQIKGVATETKKTSKTKVDIDTSTFAGKLKDLENRWKALNAEQRKGAEGQALRSEWRKLSEEAGRYTSTLRSAVSAEDRLANAKKKTTQATHEQNSAYKTKSTYLSRLVQRMVAYASIAQAFSFVRNVRDVTAEFELQRVALGSIIGDLNEANAMFEQIKAAAVKSPFQIKELVTYTKQLAAYKIESDELFETTQRLADISAGLGVGMERLVLAYGQIRATGYLRASEVRQLNEAGIPIVEELAKKMSQLRGETVSAAEVMGLISERAISFGMVKEVFDDMTSAGGMFYKMQEKQAETLAGQWSNLQDAISIMYEEIGNTEGVNNSIKGTIGLVKSLAENWRVVGGVLVSVVGSYAGLKIGASIMNLLAVSTRKYSLASLNLGRAITNLRAAQQSGGAIAIWAARMQVGAARAQRQAAVATNVHTAAWYRLKAAIMSNPLGAIVTVLTTIISIVVSLVSEMGKLENELSKIGAEGTLQADQSVRNFERLAKTIRESTDGSREQMEALKEMKRSFGELLPSTDERIKSLLREKDGYDSVTRSIREKVDAQIYEQKMNAIISDYSERVANKQKNPKEWLENMGFSVEETTRIFNAIDKAVRDGLIKVGDSTIDGAHKIEKIIKEETGKFISLTQTVANIDFSTGQYLGSYEATTRLARGLSELANVYSDYNNAVNELADSQERATNIHWKYQESFAKFQEDYGNISSSEKEDSFEWSEDMFNKRMAHYKTFIQELLAEAKSLGEDKGGISEDTYEQLLGLDNLDEVMKELSDRVPTMSGLMQELRRGFANLVPTQEMEVVKRSIMSISSATGVSMDLARRFLMKNGETTEQWRKRIHEEYEDAKKDVASLRILLGQAIAMGAETSEIEDALQKAEDIEKVTAEIAKAYAIMNNSGRGSGRGGHQKDAWVATMEERMKYMKDFQQGVEKLSKTMSRASAIEREQMIMLNRGVALGLNPKELKGSTEELLAWYEKSINDTVAKIQKFKGFRGLTVEQILSTKTKNKTIQEYQALLQSLYNSMTDFETSQVAKEMEKKLKKLSNDISRTKTAKEFFDKMLGLTGDKQLSASLTVSIYGGVSSDDLGETLAKDMAKKLEEQVQEYFGDIDISSAINKATGEIDPIKLSALIDADKMGEKNVDAVYKIIADLQSANSKYWNELMKDLEQTKTYGEKLVKIYETTQERLAKIDAREDVDADTKRQLKDRVEEWQGKEMQKLQYEAFKDSPMYVAMFEKLDTTSTAMLTNMRSHLVKLKSQWKNLDPTQFKELQSRINDIDNQLSTRNPFKGLVEGIKAMNKLGSRKEDEQDLLFATQRRLEAQQKYDQAIADGKGKEEIQRLASELQKCVDAEDEAAKKMSEWDDATRKVMQSIQNLSRYVELIQATSTAVNDVVQAFGGWGNTADEEFWNTIIEGVGGILQGTQSSAEGVARIMSGDVIGGVTSLVSGIGSIISSITNLAYAGTIKRANQEIERQQELLDNLSYSYDRLQKSAERAFGTEYIQNYNRQLSNLEAQVEAYEKQLDAERSKGKKADEDKIKEYQNQIRDTKDAIEDMYGSLSEHFLGTDLTSAARDFANAWIDAYKEFSSTTDAMKEKFQDMIQNMIVESLIAKVMERALKPVFDMVDNMGDSDFYSNSFWSQLMTEMNKATENGVVGAQNIMGMLESIGINLRDTGTGLTGISRDIASASEESILGLAAGINTQNFYISQVPTKLDTIIGLLRGGSAVVDSGVNVQDLITIQNQFLSHLPTIAQNTAETVARCERAAVACESMASKLGSVIKPKGTTSTHSVNVTIGS